VVYRRSMVLSPQNFSVIRRSDRAGRHPAWGPLVGAHEQSDREGIGTGRYVYFPRRIPLGGRRAGPQADRYRSDP
jgi:hypothetical protein